MRCESDVEYSAYELLIADLKKKKKAMVRTARSKTSCFTHGSSVPVLTEIGRACPRLSTSRGSPLHPFSPYDP